MKKFKKLLSMFLAVGCLLSVAPTVSAETAEKPMDETVYVWGKIETVGTNQIQIVNVDVPENDCVLNIGENTVVIDAVDGSPVSLDELKRLDSIAAYVSPVMTKSLPPITNAYVVIVNIPQDIRVPHYIKIGEILETTDDSIRALTTDGTLIATFLNEETEMFAYETETELSISDIHVNDEFVVWYTFELLSMPGQATMEKAMKLPEKKNGWLKENDAWYYYREGNKLSDLWIASTNGRWYYLGVDGKMAVNTVVDGCQIDENGVYHSALNKAE